MPSGQPLPEPSGVPAPPSAPIESAGVKTSASPLTQKRGLRPLLGARSPFGAGGSPGRTGGPSGNTCPRWPPHEPQRHSTRPSHSRLYATAPARDVRVNDGQPEPESYFAELSKRVAPQPAHPNTPGRDSRLSGDVHAGSVTPSRSTARRSGLRVPGRGVLPPLGAALAPIASASVRLPPIAAARTNTRLGLAAIAQK